MMFFGGVGRSPNFAFSIVNTEQVKAHHFSVKILTSGPDVQMLAHGDINQS